MNTEVARCDICGRDFSTKKGLNIHKRYHKNASINNSNTETNTEPNQPPNASNDNCYIATIAKISAENIELNQDIFNITELIKTLENNLETSKNTIKILENKLESVIKISKNETNQLENIIKLLNKDIQFLNNDNEKLKNIITDDKTIIKSLMHNDNLKVKLDKVQSDIKSLYDYVVEIEPDTSPTLSSMIASIKKLINPNKCIICQERHPQYAVVPCGHMMLCDICPQVGYTHCPLCRVFINGFMKIYY